MPLNVPVNIAAGTIAHFAVSSAPDGWIKANGANLNRLDYAALFAAWGTTHGAGDGTYETRYAHNILPHSLVSAWGAYQVSFAGSTITASAGNAHHIAGCPATVSLAAGRSYVLNIEAKAGTWDYMVAGDSNDAAWHTAVIKLSDGSVPTSSSCVVTSSPSTDGYTNYHLAFTRTNAGAIGIGIGLAATGAAYTWSAFPWTAAGTETIDVRKVWLNEGAAPMDYYATAGAAGPLATFGTPDLRGEFIRCLDDSRGIDSARALGSAQSDQNKAHTHTVPIANAGPGASNASGYYTTGGNTTTSSDGGTEARPRNIALLACIKY